MALTSASLTNNGLTTNFHVQYEGDAATMPNQTNVIANANALMTVLETEFAVTTGWFATPSGKFGTGNRQLINLNLPDTSPTSFPGANNSGYGTACNLDAQNLTNDRPTAAGRVEMVFMAEWSEILMSLTGGKWNRLDSSGEGLSQFCSILRFQAGHYNYYGSWVDNWLNGITGGVNPARSDWVTSTLTGSGSVHGDGDPVSFGCALAFLFYLNTQLNFSVNEIIAAGSSTLSAAYSTLTGDPGNPFPAFLSLIEHVYPASATAAIPGPVSDNPFPLAIANFWANKDTFGKSEVQEVINRSGGTWSEAFWVVVDGFSQSSFDALGVTVAPFTGDFTSLGITITPNPNIDYENAASPRAPQRIRIPFDLTFSASNLTEFPSLGAVQYGLATFLTVGGTKVPGSDAATEFELVAGADPYFTNIDTTPGDPNQNNAFYLSQDLRVFTATPAQNDTPVAGGPPFATDSAAGAFTYVQDLLGFLNSNYNDPNGPDPFTTVLPGQAGSLQADSSVTQFTADVSDLFHPKVYNNYNFAIARVRLLGQSGTPGQAPNVRVFFRLWAPGQSPDTDYQSSTTYLSTSDSAGLPASPLVGVDHVTIPFFASGNLGSNIDYGTGGANTRDIEIPNGRDSVWAYYGCFLNLYDGSSVIDGKQVQGWLVGTHHCLVAQIAEDEAPVFNGASPAASDKLAQRNLQVTLSDNPGPADTHRVPQTFDVRPSRPGIHLPPDELMIDWGTVPPGSVASIYWPQVPAADVVALASTLYSTHTLAATELNTISCKVTGGVTYLPVPRGTGENFAGLLTIELPQTIVTGQEFNVLVRRISTRVAREAIVNSRTMPTEAPGAQRKGRAGAGRRAAAKAPEVAAAAEGGPRLRTWRYVVGTFVVKIPVSTSEVMLFPEENTLAILRWRLEQTPPANRWYLVLKRLIDLTAARVDGLGGDSGSILPSRTGIPIGGFGKRREREYAGRVCEVLFDCFGDFQGFVLTDCGGERHFRTRKHGIEKLVVLACQEDLKLCVIVDEEREDRIVGLALRGC